jgi:hypothetical protein
LHKGAQGLSLAHYERDPEISAGVNVALQIHSDVARATARAHKLPFNGEIPVFVERLPLQHLGLFEDGVQVAQGSREYLQSWIDEHEPEGKLQIKKLLGDRVGALRVHWLPDKLRDKWIATTQKTGAYYQASVGSKVNLPKYVKTAAARINSYMARGGIKTADMIRAEDQLRNLLKDHIEVARVFTPYTSMNPQFPSALVVGDINDKLQTRHAPAIGGEKGTAYADQILLQLDTRKSKNADNRKTRGTARSNKRSNRAK